MIGKVRGLGADADRHRPAGERGAQLVVMIGQGGQRLAERRREIALLLHPVLWRQTVGLGPQHVDAERHRMAREDLVDQLRHDLPRPGPLADRLQARLVDRYDHHRRRRAHPRQQPGIVVEQPEPEPAEQRAADGDLKDQEGRQHGYAGEPPASLREEPDQPVAPAHRLARSRVKPIRPRSPGRHRRS